MPRTYKCIITATRQQIEFLESYIRTAFCNNGAYHLGDVDIHQDKIFRLPVREIEKESELDPVFECLVVFVDAENRNNSFFSMVRGICVESCMAEYEEDRWGDIAGLKNIVIFSRTQEPPIIQKRTKLSFERFLDSEEFRELHTNRQASLIQQGIYLNDKIGTLMVKRTNYETLVAIANLCEDE